MADHPTEIAGHRIGPYRLQQRLARGGMGEVYLAIQDALEAQRVIKIIHDKMKQSRQAQGRFRREAKILAKLHHPGIVRVIDFGRLENGWPWLCTEYVPGPDLETFLGNCGPQSLRAGATLLKRMAEAIEHAHSENIIHRDIKPANTLLYRGDLKRPKIIDFGIARVLSPEATRITSKNQVIGTANYIAPEQAQGREDVGTAADIYALAATAFEVWSGESVFPGLSTLETLAAHMCDPPERLSQRIPGIVPKRLDDAIDACLSKNPEDRPTAEELVDILANEALEEEPQPKEKVLSSAASTPKAPGLPPELSWCFDATLSSGTLEEALNRQARSILRDMLDAVPSQPDFSALATAWANAEHLIEQLGVELALMDDPTNPKATKLRAALAAEENRLAKIQQDAAALLAASWATPALAPYVVELRALREKREHVPVGLAPETLG